MQNINLLLKRSELNDFTTMLRYQCVTNGDELVVLRDGMMIKVVWVDIVEYEERIQGFKSTTQHYWFECDGSSITSHDYDIISFNE